MVMKSSRFAPGNAPSVTILAAFSAISLSLLLTACSPQNMPPQQVQAENPSVSYKYRGDQELINANQKATTFCSQYRSIPRTVNITDNSDGSKTVAFDCVVAPATVPATTPLNSNLAYNYSTDQQLLDASRNADIYCANNGSRRTIATIVTNTDGTKTVTFQCTP